MKLLNRYHIWRYQRYRQQKVFSLQRKPYVDIIASRLAFVGKITLKTLVYRQRRGYALYMYTDCLGELLEATQEVLERINHRSYGIDRMGFQQKWRDEIDYDRYLVDQESRPYYEATSSFSKALTETLHPLITQLRSLRQEDEILYAYYQRVIEPLFKDWDEFLDTTVRLQLGMNNE